MARVKACYKTFYDASIWGRHTLTIEVFFVFSAGFRLAMRLVRRCRKECLEKIDLFIKHDDFQGYVKRGPVKENSCDICCTHQFTLYRMTCTAFQAKGGSALLCMEA